MRLEIVDDCMNYDYTIDGTDLVNCSLYTVKDVLHKLINKEKDVCTLQAVFHALVESQGSFDFIGTDEQYDDTVVITHLDI